MELGSVPTRWASSSFTPLDMGNRGLPREPFMDLLPGVMWKGCSPPCFPCWSSRGERLEELDAEITPGLPTPACSMTAQPWAQLPALAPCLLQPDLLFPLAFTYPETAALQGFEKGLELFKHCSQADIFLNQDL